MDVLKCLFLSQNALYLISVGGSIMAPMVAKPLQTGQSQSIKTVQDGQIRAVFRLLIFSFMASLGEAEHSLSKNISLPALRRSALIVSE